MKKLSIVIPVFNEEAVFPELLRRITQITKTQETEIIFIDDGSVDNTRSLIRSAVSTYSNIMGVFFSRNFGHQKAVRAGLIHATGDVIVVMDGDLQDPPELIPQFLTKIQAGYDVVYAVRKKRKENILKRVSYSVFYRLLHKISGDISIPQDSGDFSAMTRRVVDMIKQLDERNQFVRGIRSWVGFPQIGIEYERDQRFAGETKYSLRKLFRLAYDGIFSFSYVPLLMITWLGFISAFGAFLGIITILYFRIFTATNVPGFASTAIFILFLGGVQLISIGVIGEYIRRIYDEVKRRPHFIVSEVVTKNDQVQ